MKASLALAEYFKCSPFEFIDREPDEIMNLHRETLIWIRERRV